LETRGRLESFNLTLALVKNVSATLGDIVGSLQGGSVDLVIDPSIRQHFWKGGFRGAVETEGWLVDPKRLVAQNWGLCYWGAATSGCN
jgi:hypothetical protein